jgi:hypothetical protein
LFHLDQYIVCNIIKVQEKKFVYTCTLTDGDQ